MGQRHRYLRSLEKGLLRDVLRKAGSVVPLKEVRRVLRDPGYKETEYGELRSTIRKLTEHEIMERISARATYDIQRQEDERFFAMLDMIADPQHPGRADRYKLLQEDWL